MISIERLYSRQCPKSLNAEQTPKGATPLTLEDILNIIGQVQHKHMVGSFVLDAKIAMDEVARARLVGALQCQIVSTGLNPEMAFALAETAVHEAIDTNICPKCHGTGQTVSRRYAKLFECKRCSGVGRTIKTITGLTKAINSLMSESMQVTEYDFRKRYYDIFNDCVSSLDSAAGDASHYAKELLRRIDGNWSGVD